MRRYARVSGVAALLVLVLLAAGVVVPRPFLPRHPTVGKSGARGILLLANPIHTDLALPVDAELRRRFAFLGRDGLPAADPRVQFLVVGWGGRDFYLNTPAWSDLKLGPVARSLTVDASIMHVSIAGWIDASLPDVTALELDAAGYARMLDAILSDFTRGSDGMPQNIVGSSYGPYDRFYEARGRFTALLGCNTWTAATLRAAGLRTGIWTPLPKFLVWSLHLHERLSEKGFGDLPSDRSS